MSERRSRFGKRLKQVLLIFAAVLILPLAGALLFLQTDLGARLVRQQLVARANESLSGELELGALDIRGTQLHLTEVVLRDPQGEVVAAIDSVDLEFELVKLLKRTVHVQLLRLVRPELHLVRNEHGTNLEAALEPRSPKPKEEDKQSSTDVVFEAVVVQDGVFEQVGGAKESTVRLTDLDLEGAFSLRDGGEAFDLGVDARASCEKPRPGPAKLHASAKGEKGRRAVDIDFSAPGAELRGSATLSEDAKNFDAQVRNLVLAPDLVRAFLPQYPLIASVRASVTAARRGEEVTGEAHLSAGSGRIDAEGDFDLQTYRSRDVTVQVRDVDLSQLVARGPKSDLQMRIQGKGGGRSLDTAAGWVWMEAPQSRIEGSTFGPIRIEAEAVGGRMTLRRFEARLPGLALRASGHATEDFVAIRGGIEAQNLATLGATLGRLAGSEGLPIRGNGTLTFGVTGPARSPGVSASGGFPLLAYGTKSARELRIRLEVPGVRRPLEGDARVDVRASAVMSNGRQFLAPAMVMTIKERMVALDTSMRGFFPVSLSARGRADQDGQGLTLRSFDLSYPEARWTLEREARLRLDPERLVVGGLVLRSGEQRVALDLEKKDKQLRASLDLHKFDLSRLPKALVDPSLELRGMISGKACASGRAEEPHLSARMALEEAQVRQYRDLKMDLDATWADQRLTGEIQASGVGARVHGQFDVPVLALRTGRSTPVRADVVMENLPLALVARELGGELPLRGIAAGSLRLWGTAREPRLRAELHGREISYQEQAPVDLDTVVATDPRGRLDVKIDATSLGQAASVALDTPWTFGGLFRNAPSMEQVLRAPIALAARFDRFPLPMLEGSPTLDGKVDLRGAPLSLQGDGQLAVEGLEWGPSQTVDVTAKVDLDARGMALDARLHQKDRTLARAEARVGGTLAHLRDPKKLPRVRGSLQAEWGPVQLAELQRVGERQPLPGQEPAPQLDGIARGKLSATGTLEDPTVTLDATIDRLGSAGDLGDLAVRYRYGEKTSVLDADLRSERGGEMILRGRVPLDLSWSNLKNGVAWEKAPIRAKLEAKAFDPSFLSGISPKLLRIDGTMESNVDVQGTVALPRAQGRFEWNDGTLQLAESGTYEKIHLLLRGTEERLVLEELTATAGRGSAQVSGEAVREADQELRLTLAAETKEFPVITQGQLAGTLSIKADAKGTASESIADVDVVINEARMELPRTPHRDVQKLERHPNVVFLRNGKPLEQAKQGTGGAGSAGGASEHQTRIRVQAPRNLWIVGDDVNVELGLGEGFRFISADQPQVFGELKVIRGRVEVLGKRFQLERDSALSFSGPPDSPKLRVVALHQNQREKIDVTVEMTGTAKDLALKLSSDPQLSETEIYTLLATGRRSLRPGSGTAGNKNPASSILGGAAAAQLQRGMQQVLPLDVLSIEPTERGGAGMRVEAGTYVSDRVYLGIESDLGAERETVETDKNRHQLNAEVRLRKRWNLELEYGDAQEGKADLLWRKEY